MMVVAGDRGRAGPAEEDVASLIAVRRRIGIGRRRVVGVRQPDDAVADAIPGEADGKVGEGSDREGPEPGRLAERRVAERGVHGGELAVVEGPKVGQRLGVCSRIVGAAVGIGVGDRACPLDALKQAVDPTVAGGVHRGHGLGSRRIRRHARALVAAASCSPPPPARLAASLGTVRAHVLHVRSDAATGNARCPARLRRRSQARGALPTLRSRHGVSRRSRRSRSRCATECHRQFRAALDVEVTLRKRDLGSPVRGTSPTAPARPDCEHW